MAILKVKNENGEYINIPSIKGEQGIRGEKGDKGDKGEAGKSGVHVGSEPPIDESVNIWLNPNGEASNYLATKEDIPTKTSQLINDNEYVTEMELNEAISNVGGGTGNISSDVVNSIMIVDELPEVEVEGVLYLVKEVIEEETKTTNLFTGSDILLTQKNEEYTSPSKFGGITYSFSEGSSNITMSGTATTNTVQYFKQTNTLYSGKTYKFTSKYISGEFNLGSQDYLANLKIFTVVEGTQLGSTIYIEGTTQDRISEMTFIPTEDLHEWYVYVQQKKTEVTCNNYSFEIIVEEVV